MYHFTAALILPALWPGNREKCVNRSDRFGELDHMFAIMLQFAD